MRKRLAFVLFNWFPWGGLQKDLVRIANACLDRAEITVYSMEWTGDFPDGILVQVAPRAGLKGTGGRQVFVDFIQQQVCGNYDLVVGFNRMPGLDYYFAADTCFAHKAWNERGWWYRQTPRAKQYLAFEEAVFARGGNTRIMLLSPQQREQYLEIYHTEPERLIDLPAGISREHMATDNAPELRAACRREFGIADNEYLVLQVGSSFNTKGVDRSLQALAVLPEAVKARTRFFLIGEDKPGDWLQMATGLGLRQQFRILAARKDIPRFMQGADLLLHPSRQESAGKVLLEAVVAGLPVLTTANCGYAFHVEDSGAGLVCTEPFSQQQFNGYLLGMLESDRRAWRNAGIAYGRTRDLYSMPAMVADLLLGPEQADAS